MISLLEFYLRLKIRFTNPRITPIRPINLNTVQIARNGFVISLTPSCRISQLGLPIS